MSTRVLASLAAFAALALATGCTTLADARAAKGSGPSREYAASMDKVWNTIPAVLKELELPLVSQNRA